VESFNGTLRMECLDAHWFGSLAEAKEIIEAWRREYKESRPHRAHGERAHNNCRTLALGMKQKKRTAHV
jgi:transposase InsO family protein